MKDPLAFIQKQYLPLKAFQGTLTTKRKSAKNKRKSISETFIGCSAFDVRSTPIIYIARRWSRITKNYSLNYNNEKGKNPDNSCFSAVDRC